MESTPLGLSGLRWPRSMPARHPLLRTQVRPGPGGARHLVVEGHLGERTAALLKAAVREALDPPGDHLVLDLRALSRLDPSGLAVLAEVTEHARRRGQRLAIAHLPPTARLWVIRASLHQVLELEPG